MEHELHDDNCCCSECLDDMETTVDAVVRHVYETEKGRTAWAQ